MTGTTHCICAGATALAITVTRGDPILTSVAFVTAACIGGLIPDIDHKNSKISKELKVTSFIARKVSTHRGIFHAPVFWAVLGAVGYFTVPQYFTMWIAPLLLGIATHILLDMLNPTGVPLLWPVYRKKLRIAKIKTGGKAEALFAASFPAALILWLVLKEELMLP